MRIWILFTVSAIFIAAACHPVVAQVRSDSGGSAVFGGGQSPFGSLGGGGLGGSGLGGSGLGGSGFGGGQGGAGSLSGGQQFNFNTQGGNQGGFIGRDSQDIGAIFESLNQNGEEFLNRFERSMSARDRGRGSNQGVDARPPIRVKLRLGFRPLATPAANLSAPTAGRINSLLVNKGFDGATTRIANGVATITGSVQTEGDRKMLVRLARLEPGVVRVDNRLTVSEASSVEELNSPASDGSTATDN